MKAKHAIVIGFIVLLGLMLFYFRDGAGPYRIDAASEQSFSASAESIKRHDIPTARWNDFDDAIRYFARPTLLNGEYFPTGANAIHGKTGEEVIEMYNRKTR